MLMYFIVACTEPTCDSGMKFNLDGLCVEDTGKASEHSDDTDAAPDADADTDADSDSDTDLDTDTALDTGATGEMREEEGGLIDLAKGALQLLRSWWP